MEGRASGTAGGERAAHYIADQLAAAHVEPGGASGSFFQSFAAATTTEIAAGAVLERLDPRPRAFEVAREWTPHGGSLADEVSGEVVFVGYGVAVGEGGWDDYAGLDVRGKIALALDGAPASLGDARPSRLEKLIAARRHGARALLIAADPLPALEATSAPVRLVSGSLTAAAADELLAATGKTTAGLRAALAAASTPLSFATVVKAHIRVALARADRRATNVVGVLPGTDPVRSSEAVVLGAHYDHLGRVGGAIHPGADDNASGTAVVLGLARAFAAAGGAPRTMVFALFAGEELGLLGSAHYVSHPAAPIARTVAMLNFDMVGRMRDRRLEVGGVDSGSGLRSLVASAAGGDVDLSLRDSPFEPSDHLSFYGAGVPVLFFTTGGHGDYHTPRDTVDQINAAGMAEVAGVAARIGESLRGGARPAYVALSRPEGTRRMGGSPGGTFLGVAADGQGEADGLKLASVLTDTAAARAGLRAGDVIVRLGDRPINSFEDLKGTLERKQPGDLVLVLFLRDGEDHVAAATLGARP
jgi:hypothetical protein